MYAHTGTRSKRLRQPRQQMGVMLLEALIAILIFSLGVLSIVQLQAVSVKQSSAAEFRATAALLASDLVSRMWGGDRSKASLEMLYGDQNGQGYKDWYETVEASGLPNVTEADHKPTVEIGDTTNMSDATKVTITLTWLAPGEDKDKANPTERHKYVTVVVLR